MGKGDKVNIAVNRKAFLDYEILERLEGGIELLGSEVKSLRGGQADLTGSYATVAEGQCWLVGAKIAPYEMAGGAGHEPMRRRKMLLHKPQIRKLATALLQRGFTLVPLRIYFNRRSLAKVELGLVRGKRKYDKRAKITDRQQRADISREVKRRRKKI